jgi:hypothetical protein
MLNRRRITAAAAVLGALAVAGPVAGASAATIPAPPSFMQGAFGPGMFGPGAGFPGIMNLGPTGPLGPLGEHGPLGGTGNLPTGWNAFNLGPGGPLGPGGALGGH